jgi:hypothetical protein
MTLIVSPIAHDPFCHGSEWVVEDIDLLAERVARVALGQYRHVGHILEGLNARPPKTSAEIGADALTKMKVDKNGNAWQRDGWIFQVISWIAANQQKQGAILKPPHPYHAHKGFDGLQLEIAEDGKSVTAIVIFEDKATSNPRGKITQQVWPDIVDLEAGGRVAELTSETTAMLEAQQHAFPALDIDEAIESILWHEARRYRVSVTVSDEHNGESNRKALFAGFDTSAAGDLIKRRAETMHFDDLRGWMNDFAARVTQKVNELAAADV